MKPKQFLLAAFLLCHAATTLAQDEVCKRRADIYYRPLLFNTLEQPEDSILHEQFAKLYQLDALLLAHLKTDPSLNLIPLPAGSRHQFRHGYLLEGLVNYATGSKTYQLFLVLQTACGDQEVASAYVPFQMYPTWEPEPVAEAAVNKLTEGLDIFQREYDERDAKKYGLGGDIWGGRILINMNKTLARGEETTVQLHVVDCDGMSLPDKQISFQGTAGGVFSPAKVRTNANGLAQVKFKLTSDKTAIIKAQSEIRNVWGCEDLYTGTEVIKGIGGTPVRIEIDYARQETRSLGRATLPGITIKGGEETELTEMVHRSVLYHFPSARALKEGYLVSALRDQPYPGSRTEYVAESGWFFFRKSIQAAVITAGAGLEVSAIEEGQETTYSGNAGNGHPPEVFFFKGDAFNPPMVHWNVEYPASNNGLAAGSFLASKGDSNVQWTVKKITDPKSIYKTEYLIKMKINAAEELKKSQTAMKELFGFDVDGLVNAIDPTKPKSGIAGASGTQTVTIRILSPYPD